MTRSTVIPNPASEIERLLSISVHGRCECCGGPALPVLDRHGEIMLCHRCARWCSEKGGKYTHVVPSRIDRARVDRIWAIDLGFKKLGQ